MADIQIAVIDEKDTQIALAVPGIQGPSGAISSGGSANQVFYKVSGTNYDAGWTFIGNANVDAAAAIAGTKISPNFGSQAIVTTGTNTAASFIPTSATIPSNGIYLPGANQVGVATNGTEKLIVLSNGNVGIGTSAPAATLDVTGSTYPNFLANRSLSSGGSGAAAWAAARVQATTTEQMSAGFGVQQEFALKDADAVDNTVASILVSRDGADNSGSFAIRTASAGTLGTRLHVTAGGSVGIGTTGPDANSQLHIVGSGGYTLYVNTTNAGGGGAVFFRSGTQALYTGTAGSTWLSGSSTADGLIRSEANLIFATGGNTQRAQIDTSGRLLVGTTTASGLDAAKTVVKETTAAAVQRLIGNTAAAGGDAQKITVVRNYSIVSLGTKLIIPFVSQVAYNTVTLCKVTGLRDEFNSNSPLPFEINFAVGHTNTLFNLSSYGGQGNFASIAASGLNVEITFTTAYTTGGIMVCIEYMTPAATLSINVPNIAMN